MSIVSDPEMSATHQLLGGTGTDQGNADQPEDDEKAHVEEENRLLLDREKMARMTELSAMAATGNRLWPHKHGFEPGYGSKFWAGGDDDYSSSESMDELNVSTPTLLREAVDGGFTLEQIRQAESELETPSPSSVKGRARLKEGSISKRIVDAWLSSRRKTQAMGGTTASPTEVSSSYSGRRHGSGKNQGTFFAIQTNQRQKRPKES
jgi:hypothetical protein